MIPASRRSGALAVLLAAAGVLAWAGPRPGDLADLGRLAGTPVDEAIATVAGFAAELCFAYVALSAVLVGLARLPGLAGRLAGGLAVRVTPVLLRRALETTLGVTVATASVAASGPALAAGPTSTRPPAVLATSTAPPPSPPALPSLDRPANPAPPPAPAPVPVRASADVAVVVHRGDCLWRIAARHLSADATDAQIAAAWPQWYAANRDVIGPDPDLLLPGQRLRSPR